MQCLMKWKDAGTSVHAQCHRKKLKRREGNWHVFVAMRNGRNQFRKRNEDSMIFGPRNNGRKAAHVRQGRPFGGRGCSEDQVTNAIFLMVTKICSLFAHAVSSLGS